MEVILALTVLSVALLGFFQTFDTALNSSYRVAQETIAINLCRGLMAEVVSKSFEEPGSGDLGNPPPPLGPDAGETTRNSFDDVDDYNNYTESPPCTVDGTPMNGAGGTTPNYSSFSRSVSVVYCDISGANIVDVAGPTDYKHITVSVSGPYVANINISEIKAR